MGRKTGLLVGKKTYACNGAGCGSRVTDYWPPLMPKEGLLAGWIAVSQIVTTNNGQGRLEKQWLFCKWACFPGGALADAVEVSDA